MFVAGYFIVTHRKTGETHRLTRAEFDRFFDNRDPTDWII